MKLETMHFKIAHYFSIYQLFILALLFSIISTVTSYLFKRQMEACQLCVKYICFKPTYKKKDQRNDLSKSASIIMLNFRVNSHSTNSWPGTEGTGEI